MNEPTWNNRNQLAVSASDELPKNDLTHNNDSEAKGFRWGWLAFIMALLAVFYLGSWSTQRASTPAPLTVVPSLTSTQNTPVVVHVAGAVKQPGVYSLPAQARISLAIQKAGGPLPNADINQLNLADWAKDGTRIEVPQKPKLVVLATPTPELESVNSQPVESEVEQSIIDSSTRFEAPLKNNEEIITETPARQTLPRAADVAPIKKKKQEKPKKKKAKKPDTIAGMPRALTPEGKPSDNASPEFLKKNPLNLNRATAEQLEALPGVGPSLAQKILDFRKQNGGFKAVEELDNVPGIGPKKLEEIAPLVAVE